MNVQSTLRSPETTAHLTHAQKLVRQEISAPPIASLIGFTLSHAALGQCVAELDAGPQHANPMGTLHGGVVCDLADAAMGVAMSTTLEDNETFTTLDLTSKYFKPIWSAHIRATAQVVKRTRSLGLIECVVEDETGSLVARVYSSCMVLRGSDARGR